MVNLNLSPGLLVLSAIYALVIIGVFAALRRVGVSRGRAVFLSFLVFGTSTGLLLTDTYPSEGTWVFNVYSAWAGEWVYGWATGYFGAGSPAPHYSVPWPLRIPQVFLVASFVLWGGLGAVIQVGYNRVKRHENE